MWQTGVLGTSLGEIWLSFCDSCLHVGYFSFEAVEKPREVTFLVIGLYVAGQVVLLSEEVENLHDKLT